VRRPTKGCIHVAKSILKLETCQESHGLPTVVIIKGRKEDWHDEFLQGIEVYERLKMLQGSTIPTVFGQGTYNDSPVLILSEVIGKTLMPLPIASFLYLWRIFHVSLRNP
jgi:hypothetical protein